MQTKQCGTRKARLFQPGEVVGRQFVVQRLLAQSRHNTLYYGIDRSDGRAVVLKHGNCAADLAVCSCGAAFDVAYEGLILRRLERAGVRAPRLVARGWWGERYCLAMEYIGGASLGELIEQERVSPRQAVQIALRLCRTLGQIHALGLVHHDVKPSNVIVDGQGRVTLIDWGAGQRQGSGSRRRRVPFTPGFASFAQLRGEARPANDIYGLGRLLEEAVPRPGPLLAGIIARATDEGPRGYSSAGALHRDLLQVWKVDTLARRFGFAIL